MRIGGVLMGVLGLAGCGAGSGILVVGPNTYTVSEMRSPALGGGVEARRVVLAEMHGFCGRQNRVAVPLVLAPDGDPFTAFYPTAFDATFRCVEDKSPTAYR